MDRELDIADVKEQIYKAVEGFRGLEVYAVVHNHNKWQLTTRRDGKARCVITIEYPEWEQSDAN